MKNTGLYEKELAFQADRRKACVELIKIVSDLWYDKSIELIIFRNQLIDYADIALYKSKNNGKNQITIY